MLDETQHIKPLKFFLANCKTEIKWLFLNAIFYAAGNLSVLLAYYYLGRVVDALNLHGGTGVEKLLVIILLFILGWEVFYRLGHICENIVLSRVRAKVKKALFDHTQSLSFGFFADRFAGEMAHKVATAATAFETMILMTTNGFFESAVLAIVTACMLGSVNIYYGFLITFWSALFLVGSLKLAGEMSKRSALYAAEEAKTTGALVDIYSNIAAVKVYSKNQHLQNAHTQINTETAAYKSMGWWNVLVFNFQGLSIVILSLSLVLVSSYLYRKGILTLGDLVFISAVGLRIFSYVWDMGRNLTSFMRYRGEAIQNLNDLVVAPAVIDGDHKLAKKLLNVEVAYQNVTFGYGVDQKILDNFSITIAAGEKLGIVGLSGAGKTTFVNLLLRFFDLGSGKILINGQNIAELTQESLRSVISYISQDTSLFHDTIAKNIAYGLPAASLKEIKKAAKFAYADEFIESLPKEYESIVGERGIKLSGGQRQRIAIARAILADRPLFLLDEATSALDSDSEAKIQKGLVRLMENKTVIAVAHRLSTLSHLDRIIYIENGKIIEDGTHTQLLSKNNKYAKLWHMQAGGFLPESI